jgi:Disulphide bond corrector protein DsbC
MKRLRLTILSLLCTLMFAASDFGPSKGSRFPGLERVQSLRGVVGQKGGAILVDGSKALLIELEQHREAFHKLGLGVAGVSYDSIAALPGFTAGAARTGWFVLDAKGVIVAKYFEDDPGQCYTSAAILVHQFGWIPPDAPREVEGKQLTAQIGASNSTVAPGQRVTLTLAVELQPNMHVYAPGVEGYIPIDWKMEDSATAQVHAAVFPRAEKLYLKAIDETVPAYRSHFRLTRDITIPAEDKLKSAVDGSGYFTVAGSLRYQACDDRVCYIPQTLPVQWTFGYQSLDK